MVLDGFRLKQLGIMLEDEEVSAWPDIFDLYQGSDSVSSIAGQVIIMLFGSP